MQGKKRDVFMVGNFSTTALKGLKLRPSHVHPWGMALLVELRVVGCSVAAINDDPVKCVLSAV